LLCFSPFPPGGSIGGSRVITPEVPFSFEDLTSDYIFYVQNSDLETAVKQDVFSFYISDGHTQTEAFNVEINIQVKQLITFIKCKHYDIDFDVGLRMFPSD